jgi:hypothetical protein
MLAREKDVREPDAEAFENKRIEGTYYRPEQTIEPSNIQGSY